MSNKQVWPTRKAPVYKGAALGQPQQKSRYGGSHMRTRFVASLGAAVAMMALALTSCGNPPETEAEVVGQSQAPGALTEQDVVCV